MEPRRDAPQTIETNCMKGNKSAANIPGRELIITRVFDAPRDLVFNAWTDPKHVAQWWGPERLHEDDP
jgi:hypothetical protein